MSWFLFLLSSLLIPHINAKSAILMDYATGKVLWAHNEREKLPPASLTKILSAIVILERGNLDDIVTVGENPSKVQPSVLGLKKGDKISLRTLLTAMLIRSANDAAVASAEYIAGSEGEFVKLMNEKARELGALDSNFVNCHGLHHPLHYSTAYDIALLTRYALHNPTFASIVATPVCEVKWWSGKEETMKLENTNKLLFKYPYANGVKTGFTNEAGRCLSASAKKGDWQVICVILNSPTVWKDAMELFEFAFNNFHPCFIAKSNMPIARIKVKGNPDQLNVLAKEDLLLIAPRDQQPSIRVQKVINRTKAPIRVGEKVGVLKVDVNGRYWGETDLIAGNNVAPEVSQIFSSFSFKFSLLACVFLFVLRLWEEKRNKFGLNNRKR